MISSKTPFLILILFGALIQVQGGNGNRLMPNSLVETRDEFGATQLKNQVKGPSDLGIYFINSPGVACGGMKTSQCSTSCAALGYPVYWCYPKVCYCHFGSQPNDEEIPFPDSATN